MVPLGTPAPDFALADPTGRTVHRDDFATLRVRESVELLELGGHRGLIERGIENVDYFVEPHVLVPSVRG